MKYICILLLFIGFELNNYSQIQPSVYTGYGIFTNLGGPVGVGSEFRYKIISFNCAVGIYPVKFSSHTIAQSRFDYDFGLKLYSKYGLFVGINYGIIGDVLYNVSLDTMRYEKIHGFSFTLGYRWSIYYNVFGLVYFGLTSDKRENIIDILGNKGFIPRLGILIGYDFKKKD